MFRFLNKHELTRCRPDQGRASCGFIIQHASSQRTISRKQKFEGGNRDFQLKRLSIHLGAGRTDYNSECASRRETQSGMLTF